MQDRVRLAILITRLIRGGAQRIALQTFLRTSPERFDRRFLTGPDLGAEGDFFAEARAAGVEPVVVRSLHREISPGADLAALVWLVKYLRRERIEILHTHTSKAGFLGAVAARLAGTPVVVYTPHGHIFGEGARIPGVEGRGRRAMLLRLRRLAERWSDRIVALNQEDLEEQVALGLAPREKYVVVPNGIDLGVYESSANGQGRDEVRADLRIRGRTPTVAVVGRLTTEKGQDVLIRALARLGGRRAPVLLIIGGGPEEAALREMCRSLGVEERVRFLGVRTDVPVLLRGADIVVLPSRYESGGLALMEAMASGLPVIASDVGGVPDLIRDGEEGLLVPPGDPEPLADAIHRVIYNPRLAGRLAAAGRAKVRRDHTIDRTATILQGLYAKLLTEKRLAS